MASEQDEELSDSDSSLYYSAWNLYLPEVHLTNNVADARTILTRENSVVSDKDVQETKNKTAAKSFTKYFKITRLHLFLPWLALFLYIVDVVSDQVLAIRYAVNKEWTYAGLTYTFVVLPAFYISMFVGKTWKKIIRKGWKWWPLLIPLWFFNLEPAVQYVKNFLFVRRYLKAKNNHDVEKQKKYFDSYIKGHRSVSDLKYSESLMEAVPQFTLQGYILLSTYENITFNDTLLLQIASLNSSIVGIAVIIYTRHKVFLLAHGWHVTSFGRTLWSSGRFFSLGARTLSMTASASVYPGYTFIGIGIHWFLAATWRYTTHLKELGYIEPIFQGAADTLVPRVDTVFSNVISHIVLLAEDIAMIIIWALTVGPGYDNIRVTLVSVVITINIIGSVSDILYKIYNHKLTNKVEI